jgi:hypothetical protein
MNSRIMRLTLGLILAAVPALLAGCGSSSGSSDIGSGSQTGNVNMMVSDASTEDWATIGVKIMSISLIPQGNGSNVNVYSATEASAPMINLVQLDQLGEIIGNATIPVGTYTGAVVTISGNPTDIQLISSADPSAALLALCNATTTVPSSQIQVQGTTGAAGNLTVPVTVNLDSNLVVTANTTNALDLEFDLSHPAFIVGHMPPANGGTPVWAINFNGPLHHHPIPDITKFLLRDIYGTVTSVNMDGSLTITRDFPAEPAAAAATSEAAVSTTRTLQILPDAVNDTLFYDEDNKSQNQKITSFSTVATDLPAGEFVRVAARYQPGGTLVAVRVYAASSFGNVYVSPEGHVLHVNTTTDIITVEDENGRGVPLQVTNSTVFYQGATQISTTGAGIAFLTNLERGFKIHGSVVFPLTNPLQADTINIETARYDGVISIPGASTTDFTYTRKFGTAADDYTVTLPYASAFEWWNLTYPTLADSGASAIPDFISATNGTVNFGGTPPIDVSATGATFAKWNGSGWAAPWVILDPTQIPLGTAATGFVYTTGNPTGSFTMQVPLGTQAVTVNLSTVSGSATLVYEVDRIGPIVTITPVDITTTAGQTIVKNNLVPTTPVDVFGVPQANDTIKAYVVFYYTGVKPTAVD